MKVKSTCQWILKICPWLYLICCIFSACDSNNTINRTETSLKIAFADNPTNLDPRLGRDVASYRITEHIFRYLVQKDSMSNIVPDIAESWRQPDDKTYVFQLRKGIFFHDGKECTSADVKFTFDSICNPSFGSPYASNFMDVDSIEAPDKYTVVFRMKAPNASFLTYTIIGIVPKHLAEKDGGYITKQPVGTGPYRLEEWRQDDKIILTAFNQYFGKQPKIRRIEFRILPEATTRVFSMETGETDFLMNDVPLKYLERLEANPNLVIETAPGEIYEYIGLNLRNMYLKNPVVRKAIAHAIDRRQMINAILSGYGTLATSVLAPTNWAHHPDLPVYDYDPDKAKRLLDNAGFQDPDEGGPQPRFTLVYKFSSQNQESRIKAQIIQQYLAEIGIAVQLEGYEWATFFDDINHGRFDLYSLRWVGITDPDTYFRIFHSTGSDRNGYANPEMDELLEQGRSILENNTRRAIYFNIQENIAEDLPYISLWYRHHIVIRNRHLRGFIIFPAGDYVSMRNMWWE